MADSVIAPHSDTVPRPFSPAHQLVLDSLAGGMTLRQIWAKHGSELPKRYKFHEAISRDPALSTAYYQARAAGMIDMLEESIEHSLACRLDKSMSIGADKYASVVARAAALLAPKAFGQLIKHADADGNSLSVSVVSYAKRAPDLIEATAVDVTPGKHLSTGDHKI